MLELDAIGVRYGESDAVRGVTLAVAEGEWLGLIGPNGAGKSTLLAAIASLTKHTGTIHVDGTNLGGLSHRRLARLIAYVPQQPEKPAGMTVLDYVLLGRTPHIGYLGVESNEDRRQCTMLLERLGIGRLAARMLPTLSGGEMQRAVLARALAQQAPVLLLDEPTSALDLGGRIDALELVDELRLERNLTVLSAIHDLTLAAQFADRLLLMDRGEAVVAGTPDEVLHAGRLSHHFGGHVHVMRDPSGALIVAPVRAHTHLAAVNRETLGALGR
jgi:iron complex transport system ATP-binding protein